MIISNRQFECCDIQHRERKILLQFIDKQIMDKNWKKELINFQPKEKKLCKEFMNYNIEVENEDKKHHFNLDRDGFMLQTD